MPEQVIQASYCTTCKGRLWQLRETLAHNLTVIGDDEEIVLVDFDSPDDLGTWVWESFGAEVEAGRLRFFELLDEAPWHAAKAKNLAHRLARGGFLFNLDADNFLTSRDRELIRAASATGRGCRQNTGDLRDGTPGRIGLQREAFYEIGGYDEGLLGSLVQDFDIIVRAEAAGHRFVRLPPPERQPVHNEVGAKLEHYVVTREGGQADLAAIGRVNFALSKLRRELEGPRRRQNFASYHGRLNGEEVIFDGLGNLTLAK